ALAASRRSGFQILTKFDHAPGALNLSALSGLIYIVATIALATTGRRAWHIAHAAVWFELIGGIVIGIWSLITPQLFWIPTVWSTFGIGYGFIPLVLPIIGLYWLHRHRPQPIT